MKTGNFPRAIIEQGRVPMTPEDWLISITDRTGEDATVPQPFERILFLKFNDTHKVGDGELDEGEARQIADFIKEGRELGKNIYANCHAGICRSGAVVSLMIDLGWEDLDDRNSPGRIPNFMVYGKVRQHFPEVRHSWDPPLPDFGKKK